MRTSIGRAGCRVTASLPQLHVWDDSVRPPQIYPITFGVLERIRAFFNPMHVAGIILYLDELIALGESSEGLAHDQLRAVLKNDKFLSLRMGTIGGNSVANVEKDRFFRDCCLELARIVNTNGLTAIYSKDVLNVFGRWKEEGV